MQISGATYNPFANSPFSSHAVSTDRPGIPAQVNQTTSPNQNPVDQISPVSRDNSSQPPDSSSATNSNEAQENTNQSQATTVNGQQLTQEQLRIVEQLQQTDAEVRRHEMAHVAAGGQYITSGANFTYQRGPDGRSYAVGGEVGIDTSPIPGDPQATVQKMRQIRSAALAPANPSPQDLKVASQASSNASKAMSELMILQAQEQAETNETQAFGNIKDASNSYETVQNLPETDESTFQVAG